jgi:hypothetical protein
MEENAPDKSGNPYSAPNSPLHQPGELSATGKTAPARCPHCGTKTDHPLITAHREKIGCRHLVLLVFTGIIFYFLWAMQRPRPFGCAACGKLFHARTPGGKVALGVLLCLVAVVIGIAFLPANH